MLCSKINIKYLNIEIQSLKVFKPFRQLFQSLDSERLSKQKSKENDTNENMHGFINIKFFPYTYKTIQKLKANNKLEGLFVKIILKN